MGLDAAAGREGAVTGCGRTSAPLPSCCPGCCWPPWPGEPTWCSLTEERRVTPSDLWSQVPDARAVFCCRAGADAFGNRAALPTKQQAWASSGL
jgi:hypothetical protein